MDFLRLTILVLTSLFAISTEPASASDYFWHITDFHYDPDYWTNQESCNEEIPPSEQGRYGNYMCDAPWELVKSSVQSIYPQGNSPQFLIWTGDSSPHPKNESSMSTERVIEILANSTNLIKDTFQNVPVFVTLGNHDYYPSSQMPGEQNEVYTAAAEMWKDWIDTEEAQSTFRKGGYYTKMMPSRSTTPLRAVIANTNLYYNDNKVTETQTDPGGQYQWLEEVFTNATRHGEKVHLITHIPTGVLELPGQAKWIRAADNKRFNDIIIKYANVIVGIYSSHQHFDSFRLFYDNDGKAVSSMFIVPSVTPWRARLGNGIQAKAHNPGVRKVYYDTFSLHLMDYEQYWLDLPKANRDGIAQWKKLYSFRAAYGTENITTAALQEVLTEFKHYASETFHTYFQFNSVNLDPLHSSNLPCSCKCKDEHLCAIEFVYFDEYAACLDKSDCSTAGGNSIFISRHWLLSTSVVLIVLNIFSTIIII